MPAIAGGRAPQELEYRDGGSLCVVELREEAKERLWMNKALKRALSAKSGDGRSGEEVRRDAIAG